MRGEAVRGEGRKKMKEDIAGSNERGTRREERPRQGIYNRGAGESRGKKTVLLPFLQFLLGFLIFFILNIYFTGLPS